ncbi:MAG: hypothetical protein JXA43_03715 [Candidatus Diapherotrites archaeon]|nr:hypothetical protein [Candidatus Diapherotrites archaeon]
MAPYSDENAQLILTKINEKGFNLYDNTEVSSIQAEGVISKGPVKDKLELNVPHVMLPTAEDPSNPEQVFAALEELAQKKGRNNMPSITIGVVKIDMLGLTLESNRVKIHSSYDPEEIRFAYKIFIEAIETLESTKD